MIFNTKRIYNSFWRNFPPGAKQMPSKVLFVGKKKRRPRPFGHCAPKLETFRFWEEYDYEYEIFSMVSSARAWAGVIWAGKRGSRRHSTTRFSECHSGENKLSNVRSFIILQSGEALTSFNNDNSANLSGEKKYNEEFPGVYFLTIGEKNLNEISYS